MGKKLQSCKMNQLWTSAPQHGARWLTTLAWYTWKFVQGVNLMLNVVTSANDV